MSISFAAGGTPPSSEPLLFTGAELRPGSWPFGGLEPWSYDFIMADPPWRFELQSDKGATKSPQAHYETMSIEDIARLPVADLAKSNCLLWLWATAPMIDQQLGVMARWGFRFVTSGVWVKTTKNGHLGFGGGYFLRNAHEPFLLGMTGNVPMPPEGQRDVRSVVSGSLREHSRKPEQAYAAAERMMTGGVRRCDLYSRTNRPGWDAWGNEVGKFNSNRGKIT